MKTVLENSKYLSLIAVVALLFSFLLALYWGVVKAFNAGRELIMTYGQSSAASLLLIKVIDAFLIAVVLYVLAASVYRLFIGELNLPSRLVASNLPELEIKLSGIIVLVMAVRFAEFLFEGLVPSLELLWLGLATAAVAGALIAFGYFIHGDEPPTH